MLIFKLRVLTCGEGAADNWAALTVVGKPPGRRLEDVRRRSLVVPAGPIKLLDHRIVALAVARSRAISLNLPASIFGPERSTARLRPVYPRSAVLVVRAPVATDAKLLGLRVETRITIRRDGVHV